MPTPRPFCCSRTTEKLILLTLFGLAVALLGPVLFQPTHCGLGTRQDVARVQIQGLGMALDAYRQDVGHYPKSLRGLVVRTEPKWDGPYLRDVQEIPKDPWGDDYVYAVERETGGYVLFARKMGNGRKDARLGLPPEANPRWPDKNEETDCFR